MSKNKTTLSPVNPDDFIRTINDVTKRADCFQLIELLKQQTGLEPKLWGSSIVGFGNYHYKYESGHEGESPLISFSPRSSSIAIYLSGNLEKRDELLQKLGKHKTDKACIHIKCLKDINIDVLQIMFINHIKRINELYP